MSDIYRLVSPIQFIRVLCNRLALEFRQGRSFSAWVHCPELLAKTKKESMTFSHGLPSMTVLVSEDREQNAAQDDPRSSHSTWRTALDQWLVFRKAHSLPHRVGTLCIFREGYYDSIISTSDNLHQSTRKVTSLPTHHREAISVWVKVGAKGNDNASIYHCSNRGRLQVQ